MINLSKVSLRKTWQAERIHYFGGVHRNARGGTIRINLFAPLGVLAGWRFLNVHLSRTVSQWFYMNGNNRSKRLLNLSRVGVALQFL